MPAALPGDTAANNAGNPNAGRCVMFDPLSGPKGSPFDAKKPVYNATDSMTPFVNDPANISTGALSTGLGYGSPPIFGPPSPASIVAAGFQDNYTPGITKPDATAAVNSTLVYIGGGRSLATGVPNPYDETAVALGMAGNGGSRDAGAGPAFTAFAVKTVTAVGAVANGAAVEAGWINRSGVGIVLGQSVFGSSTAANAAPV